MLVAALPQLIPQTVSRVRSQETMSARAAAAVAASVGLVSHLLQHSLALAGMAALALTARLVGLAGLPAHLRLQARLARTAPVAAAVVALLPQTYRRQQVALAALALSIRSRLAERLGSAGEAAALAALEVAETATLASAAPVDFSAAAALGTLAAPRPQEMLAPVLLVLSL